jgi:hypothetical protein
MQLISRSYSLAGSYRARSPAAARILRHDTMQNIVNDPSFKAGDNGTKWNFKKTDKMMRMGSQIGGSYNGVNVATAVARHITVPLTNRILQVGPSTSCSSLLGRVAAHHPSAPAPFGVA